MLVEASSGSSVSTGGDGSADDAVDGPAAAAPPNPLKGLGLASDEFCPKENVGLDVAEEPKLKPELLGGSVDGVDAAGAGEPKLKAGFEPEVEADGDEAPKEKPLLAAVLGVPLGVDEAPPNESDGVVPPGPNLPSLDAGAENANVLGGVAAAVDADGFEGPNANSEPDFDGVEVEAADGVGAGVGGASPLPTSSEAAAAPLNMAGTCHDLSLPAC